MPLPPGPPEPAAIQMYEWVARPTALLRRCQARYGEPFTLKIAWSDAPMVFISDPAEIKRVFAAPQDVLRGGESSSVLEPFAGPHSILLLHGAEHLRQRKLMLPPFHGEALARWRDTIAALAHQELDGWTQPVRSLERMQGLTLEVILRVVFGSGDPELRDAIRRTLDMTTSMPRLVAMSLVQKPVGPWKAFMRAVERLDALIYERIDAQADDGSVLAVLRSARHEDGSPPTREEMRDQLVTLLAAGHETTAGALAWSLERLARHPDVLARVRAGDDEYLDAVVKEVLRVRPVLSIVGAQDAGRVRGRRLDAPAGRARDAVHLPHAPSPRPVGRADRVPARAVPERRAGAVRVHPVRRRNAPLPRRGVRDARDARGAPRGRAAVRARPRSGTGGADAPPLDHAHARAGWVRGAGAASVFAAPCRCSVATTA